jgi:hypothetical protein
MSDFLRDFARTIGIEPDMPPACWCEFSGRKRSGDGTILGRYRCGLHLGHDGPHTWRPGLPGGPIRETR